MSYQIHNILTKHFGTGGFICLLCLWNLSGYGQQKGFSVEQCVSYALQNNYTITSAKLDEEIAVKYIKQVRSIGLPQITASGTYEDNLKLPVSLLPAEITGGEPGTFRAVQFGTKHNLTGRLRFDQLLYDGSFWVGMKAAKKSYGYYNQLTRLQKENVVYTVSRAYYQALVSQKQIEVIAYNLRNTEELLKVTNLLYENGLAKKTDRDRIQVNYTNLLSDLKGAQREATKSLNGLKFEMGMPISEPLTLSEVATDINIISQGLDTMATTYYTNRIDFKVLQVSSELLAIDLRSIRSGYQPTLGAYASAATQAQRQEFNFFDSGLPWFKNYLIGLQLNIPLFDGLQKSAQIQQAKLNVKKNEVERSQLMQRVSLEVANSMKDYSNTISNLDEQNKNVELAMSVFESVKMEYQEGTIYYNDVVDAETSLRNAQTNYTTSLLNVYLAKMDLLKAQGKLLNYMSSE